METVEGPRRLGTVKDVAQRLGVSERWVWKALAAGHDALAVIRLGRAVRFDMPTLDRWIDAQSQRGAS